MKAALFAASVVYPGACQPTWFARSRESGALFLSYEAEDAELDSVAGWIRRAGRWLSMPVHDGPDAGQILRALVGDRYALVAQMDLELELQA